MKNLLILFLVVCGISYYNSPELFNNIAESVGSESRAPVEPPQWNPEWTATSGWTPERIEYACYNNPDLDVCDSDGEHNPFANASGYESMGELIPNELIRLNAELNLMNGLNTPY